MNGGGVAPGVSYARSRCEPEQRQRRRPSIRWRDRMSRMHRRSGRLPDLLAGDVAVWLSTLIRNRENLNRSSTPTSWGA